MKLNGTYRLISSSRRILDTGEEVSAFGKNAKGSIIYGDDGRFLVLIINHGRPKPESIEALTDQQRADLHRTMSGYGGPYAFDGKTIKHHVDLAWNEVWAGTTVTRDVKRRQSSDLHVSTRAIRRRWQDECYYRGVGKSRVVRFSEM